MERQEMESIAMDTRNSSLRAMTKVYVEGLAHALHKTTGLSANGATLLGLGLEIAADVYATHENLKDHPNISSRLPVLAGKSIPPSTDFIDGAIARTTHTESVGGALLDAATDRIKEAIGGGFRTYVAYKKGNKVAMAASTGSMISNLGPSFARTLAEWRWRIVKEDGNNWREGLGTAPGRAATGVISSSFYEAQLPLDVLNIAANSLTTINRLRTAFTKDYQGKRLADEKQQLAGKKLRVFAITGGIITAVALGEHYYLNRKMQKKEAEEIMLTQDEEIDISNIEEIEFPNAI